MNEQLGFIAADAIRAIDRQASRLDELRSRAGTFVTAAAVLQSFLGVPAVTGDRRFAAIAGTMAFLAVLLAVGFVLRPRKGWRFARPGLLALASYDCVELDDPNALARAYANDLGEDYVENDEMLKPLARTLLVAVFALAAEAVALSYAAAS